MKKTLYISLAAVSLFTATVYCAQYVDFNPFADINMQMRFRVKNMTNPINPQDAATKKYVDDAIAGGGSTAYVTPEALEERITLYDVSVKNWAGGQHTLFEQTLKDWANGRFLLTEPSHLKVDGDLHVVGSSAIDGGLIVGSEIDMTGGRIKHLQSPVEDGDAATKGYVSQNFLKLVGGRMEGEINMAGLSGDKHRISNLADYGTTSGDNGYNAVNKHYVDAATNSVFNSLSSFFLPLSGGTMSGLVNMNNNRITGVPTPQAASDASPKSYVDARYSESIAYYYVDGYLFSSSSTDFSSPLHAFTFPENGGTFYAKYLGGGDMFVQRSYSLSSSLHSSSDYSIEVRVVSGNGYDPGSVFSISVAPKSSYIAADGVAAFHLYDNNHCASACLVDFTRPSEYYCAIDGANGGGGSLTPSSNRVHFNFSDVYVSSNDTVRVSAQVLNPSSKAFTVTLELASSSAYWSPVGGSATISVPAQQSARVDFTSPSFPLSSVTEFFISKGASRTSVGYFSIDAPPAPETTED